MTLLDFFFFNVRIESTLLLFSRTKGISISISSYLTLKKVGSNYLNVEIDFVLLGNYFTCNSILVIVSSYYVLRFFQSNV